MIIPEEAQYYKIALPDISGEEIIDSGNRLVENSCPAKGN
jgi:hypothetical protein